MNSLGVITIICQCSLWQQLRDHMKAPCEGAGGATKSLFTASEKQIELVL